jgi:hypothetical protein
MYYLKLFEADFLLLASLLHAAELLNTVLTLLPLLSGLVDSLGKLVSNQTVLGLEFLSYLNIVVNETKAGRFAATELGLQSENKGAVGVLDVIHLGKLLLELFLGDVGTARVKHINNLRDLNREIN